MSDPYLIAHKVRGEPAFDIAEKMECPLCDGQGIFQGEEPDGGDSRCVECEANGYWWIIPTSGHRAYPYWAEELDVFNGEFGTSLRGVPEMPDDIPDHYAHSTSPTQVRDRLAALLESLPPVPVEPFKRRF